MGDGTAYGDARACIHAARARMREVRDLLREDRATRVRLEDHERRIAAIEAARG